MESKFYTIAMQKAVQSKCTNNWCCLIFILSCFFQIFLLFDELLFVMLDMIKWIKAFRVVACSELFFVD
jgi:hypothetical protein